MNWKFLIPLFLGTIGILQGAINRQVSTYIGVAQTTFISNALALILCFLFYIYVKANPQLFPAFIQVKEPLTTFKWWFLFPPLFGFFIVAGMPIAISELGAVKVTVGLIAAQMLTSVVWDLSVESIPLNLYKVIGIVFAILSVTFIQLGK